MSDYVHKKAIRTRITDEIRERLNLGSGEPQTLYEIMKKRLPAYLIDESGDDTYFTITGCSTSSGKMFYYLDFILNFTYGVESTEFSNVSKLNKEDYDFYEPLFRKVLGEFGVLEKNSLCEVDYCYYNCSEASNCYAEYVYSEQEDRNTVYIVTEEVVCSDTGKEFDIIEVYSNKAKAKAKLQELIKEDAYELFSSLGIKRQTDMSVCSNYSKDDGAFIEYKVIEREVG